MNPIYNHLSVERIQQTDFRLSSMKAMDPIHNVERPAINYWGCLYKCLCSLVEEYAGQNLSINDNKDIYLDMIELYGDDRYRGMRNTCYVMNHEDIGNAAFSYLGEIGRVFFYVFKEVNGIQTYLKAREEYKGRVNGRIEQWSVRGAHSHFVHTSIDGRIIYNPCPQLPLERLISVRGYYLE